MLNDRQEVIDAFKTGIFPYIDGFQKTRRIRSRIRRKQIRKKKDDYKNFIEYIEHESKGINYDLFQDYFDFSVPSALAKKL